MQIRAPSAGTSAPDPRSRNANPANLWEPAATPTIVPPTGQVPAQWVTDKANLEQAEIKFAKIDRKLQKLNGAIRRKTDSLYYRKNYLAHVMDLREQPPHVLAEELSRRRRQMKQQIYGALACTLLVPVGTVAGLLVLRTVFFEMKPEIKRLRSDVLDPTRAQDAVTDIEKALEELHTAKRTLIATL